MLIHSSSQLLTLKGGPQRGHDLGALGIIPNGAVLIRDEKFWRWGQPMNCAPPIRMNHAGCQRLRAHARLCGSAHASHLAGDRANEFEMKMAVNRISISSPRARHPFNRPADAYASMEALIAQTRPRLFRMFAHGTTTVEAKSGYGLQTATELRLLKALLALEDESRIDIAITFLGAHAIAPEYKDDPQGYTDHVAIRCSRRSMRVADSCAESFPALCGCFCEDRAFNLAQSRQI